MASAQLPETVQVGVTGITRAALDGLREHFAERGHVLTSDAAIVRFAVADLWSHIRPQQEHRPPGSPNAPPDAR